MFKTINILHALSITNTWLCDYIHGDLHTHGVPYICVFMKMTYKWKYVIILGQLLLFLIKVMISTVISIPMVCHTCLLMKITYSSRIVIILLRQLLVLLIKDEHLF